MPDTRSRLPHVRLPDLSQPKKYEHRRPQRPSHLPKRLTPPPERAEPPDLRPFLYVGIVLALILLIAALPNIAAVLLDRVF